jgi:hypothetical protein
MNLMILACAVLAAAIGIGVAIRNRRRTACLVRPAPVPSETRGMAWVIGAFLICPCHLPITLGLAGALLAGTAAGAALRGHLVAAGTIVSLAWLAATWHGFRLLRSSSTRQPISIKDVHP